MSTFQFEESLRNPSVSVLVTFHCTVLRQALKRKIKDEIFHVFFQLDFAAVAQASPSSDNLAVTFPQEVTALAYLWRDTPIVTPLAAPIYAEDGFGLPAPPFKFQVQLGHVDLPWKRLEEKIENLITGKVQLETE